MVELTTHINCDLADMTVKSDARNFITRQLCSKTCISSYKLMLSLILPSYCTYIVAFCQLFNKDMMKKCDQLTAICCYMLLRHQHTDNITALFYVVSLKCLITFC